MNIVEFREKNPEYNDMPDGELSERLYKKFYSDIPYNEFTSRFLITSIDPTSESPQQEVSQEPEPASSESEPKELSLNDIPADASVTVSGIVGATGKKVKYEESARVAWADITDKISKFEAILNENFNV